MSLYQLKIHEFVLPRESHVLILQDSNLTLKIQYLLNEDFIDSEHLIDFLYL
jgi:hypothetical protein